MVSIISVRPLRGTTQPHVVHFNRKDQWIVKFKNNPLGNRTLVNEYVVAQLARMLQLPIPSFRVVNLPKEVIKKNRILRRNHFESGNQFCMALIQRGSPLIIDEHEKMVHGLVNRQDLAYMIVFDQWIGNSDRTKRNIIFQTISRGKFKLYLIDHGNCFPKGRKWTINSLKKQSKKPVAKSVHKLYQKFYCNPDLLYQFMNTIIALPNEVIYSIVSSIPNDWEVTEKEKRALVKHLIRRKRVLPSIIKMFIETAMGCCKTN